MNEFEKSLIELKEDLQKLEETFIQQFIKNRTPRQDYEHNVKAYCVLCHAALEEFFESIALKVMHKCVDEWICLRKYTDTLLTLISFCEQKLEIDPNENTTETIVFDSLRGIFKNVKRDFSYHVHNNQGISIKHLRCLLIPVAIDIKEDIRLKGALNKLARERGKYAYRGRIPHVLSPEDARDYVYDCFELCEDVKTKAESKFI